MPQNAMLIKEMYQPPAARYYTDQTVTFRTLDLIPEAEQQQLMMAWTIISKDASVAQDGWFWGTVPVGKEAQEAAIRYDQEPFSTSPWTGFAQYCFRCDGPVGARPGVLCPTGERTDPASTAGA